MTVIDDFRTKEYRFLGNFYECDIEMDGMVYPSLEHAFQASKTFNKLDRASIRDAGTARAAKQIGRTVALRHDWNNMRLSVMRSLLNKKFQGKELRRRLLATRDADLVSGGDAFWGKKSGSGANHMGGILMDFRNDIFRSSLDAVNVHCREFLSDCGWERDYDGDMTYDECWTPPWDSDCQFDLAEAVEEQRHDIHLEDVDEADDCVWVDTPVVRHNQSERKMVNCKDCFIDITRLYADTSDGRCVDCEAKFDVSAANALLDKERFPSGGTSKSKLDWWKGFF